jgi:hypothetical protein
MQLPILRHNHHRNLIANPQTRRTLMDFPGFDTLALGIICFVTLREAAHRLRRIRSVHRRLESAPAEV